MYTSTKMVVSGHLHFFINLGSSSCRVVLLPLILSHEFLFFLRQILSNGMNLAISDFCRGKVETGFNLCSGR